MESVTLHQVIDAKEDMRDCQREVIESVKRRNRLQASGGRRQT
jgi:hypothetical protein